MIFDVHSKHCTEDICYFGNQKINIKIEKDSSDILWLSSVKHFLPTGKKLYYICCSISIKSVSPLFFLKMNLLSSHAVCFYCCNKVVHNKKGEVKGMCVTVLSILVQIQSDNFWTFCSTVCPPHLLSSCFEAEQSLKRED